MKHEQVVTTESLRTEIRRIEISLFSQSGVLMTFKPPYMRRDVIFNIYQDGELRLTTNAHTTAIQAYNDLAFAEQETEL